MPATTYTASSQTATPRTLHVGLIPAFGTVTNNTISYTASDVILLVKIPDRAIITGGFLTGTIGNVGTTVKVGTSADDDACLVTGSLSLTSQRNNFSAVTLPFQVSLSDDAEPKWTWLRAELVNGPSSCISFSIKCYVEYCMPGGGPLAN